MRITFALIACLTLFLTAIFLMEAKSAIHQILAAITFLSFVVSVATVALLSAIVRLQMPATIVTKLPETRSAEVTPPPRKGGTWVNVGR